MPDKTLNFSVYDDSGGTTAWGPANSSPAFPSGYTLGGDPARINTGRFSKFSGSGNTCIVDNTQLTGNVVSASIVLGPMSADTQCVMLVNAAGTGYMALINTSNGIRWFIVTAYVLGSLLHTVAFTATAGHVATLERNNTTGALNVYTGPSGSTVLRGTFTQANANTDWRAGAATRNAAQVVSLTSSFASAFSIDTLTNPLVPGGAVSGTETGFSGGAITANFGGLTISGTVSGVNITGTLSNFVDGGLCPLLPAAAVSGTFTQGANTASITRAISVPAGLQELRDSDNNPANFSGLILGDDKYLGQAFADAGNPLTTSDRSYVNPAYGLKISQDGKVELNGTDHATSPVAALPYTTTLWIRRGADGRMYSHTLTIDEESVAVIGQITSVGTVRIGGTTDVTVAGFPAAINAGTLDGVALTSASDTSITVPAPTDGGSVPRPGIRELELTGGTGTGTTDVLVSPPLGWSSYIVTGGFTQAINGVSSGYLPAGWATGDFILSPNAPSSGKTTAVSDAGVVTNNVGNQELFLVDAATGLATAFDIETTSGAGSIGTGSASEPTMQVIKMETLKMGGLSNPGSTALLLDDTQLLDDTILED